MKPFTKTELQAIFHYADTRKLKPQLSNRQVIRFLDEAGKEIKVSLTRCVIEYTQYRKEESKRKSKEKKDKKRDENRLRRKL